MFELLGNMGGGKKGRSSSSVKQVRKQEIDYTVIK